MSAFRRVNWVQWEGISWAWGLAYSFQLHIDDFLAVCLTKVIFTLWASFSLPRMKFGWFLTHRIWSCFYSSLTSYAHLTLLQPHQPLSVLSPRHAVSSPGSLYSLSSLPLSSSFSFSPSLYSAFFSLGYIAIWKQWMYFFLASCHSH